ncbi:MAG: uroporphyrinogen-III C-methyltransferase, partial [Acidobacteria bacterium]|nr:uroporphyrinogen-III C-methyltransferase [Acidobacteriota bacterium]
GVASAFLVVSGHAPEAYAAALGSVAPGAVSIVVLMGLAARGEIAAWLVRHGWSEATPAAVVCGASTDAEWTWVGALGSLGEAMPPPGAAGVLVIGHVVGVRDELARAGAGVADTGDEVMYGRGR